ncbi:NAD(P)/FAD-dependent oxidoreductase [uncultured Microscilla sp.]|uniref:NAD(P)/FAD-dependent oxidoreductase n=1 Tax=uncultured Microscilla sp. TaxID=432653 RepID=UPI00262D9CA5|nr:NAD(P)/FAD-dependent oxidoreductase [uncultured Microscilla sp.]
MDKPVKRQTLIKDQGVPRIVVVGGGFGGLELVKGLRKMNAQVVLFDRYNHHTFQPLLYQVATSGLETGSIIYPFRKSLNSQKNFFFRLGDVKHIDADNNQVETSIGSVKYDHLVIATGATTNYYGMQDIAQHAVPLKEIQDSILLRNKIIKNFENALLTADDEKRNSYMDYVIVGGGPTGVEVAGALAELKKHVFPKDYRELNLMEMDIHLVEAGPRLLGAMSEKSGEKAQQFLEKMGVKVHLDTSVKSYDGYRVTLGNNEELITKTLVWAAGVKGAPIDGIRVESVVGGNRLKVNHFNQVEGYDNIYAVGDIAAMIDDDNPKGHPMMAPPAMQQGRHLAKNLINKYEKNRPMKPFKYFNKGSMATIGRNKAVVEMPNGSKTQGFFAWIIWMFVHLMYLVGFRNRLLVLINWVMSYFSYDKSNRLIIGRTGVEDFQEKDGAVEPGNPQLSKNP